MANGNQQIENDILQRIAEAEAFAQSQTPQGVVPGSLQDPFSLEQRLNQEQATPAAALLGQPAAAPNQFEQLVQQQGGPALPQEPEGRTGLAGLLTALSAIDPSRAEEVANKLNPSFQTQGEQAEAGKQRQAAEKAAREIFRLREQESLVGARQEKGDQAAFDRAKLQTESRESVAEANRKAQQQRLELELANRLERDKFTKEAAGQKLTPQEKTLRQDIAKSTSKFLTGGRSTAINNLQDITGAAQRMQQAVDQNRGISGFGVGPAKLFFGEDEISGVASDINRVTVQSLRASIGAQFTANESKEFKALDFDPNVSTQENLRRAKRKAEIIQQKIQEADNNARGLFQGTSTEEFVNNAITPLPDLGQNSDLEAAKAELARRRAAKQRGN